MWYDDDSDCSNDSSTHSTPSASPDNFELVCGLPQAFGMTMAETAIELPHNLYLAAPGLIGMGAPTCADHIRNLHALHNVKLVINLRETPNCDDWFEGLPVRSVHLPIPSYCAPSLETMVTILGLILEARAAVQTTATTTTSTPAVAVHCLEGKGRTGTVCAAYMLYQHRDLSADEAMALIRALSPLSVESREQEEFLLHFAHLRDMRANDDGLAGLLAECHSTTTTNSCMTAAATTREGKLATSSDVVVPSKWRAPTRCRPSLATGLKRVRSVGEAAGEEDDDELGWYCS